MVKEGSYEREEDSREQEQLMICPKAKDGSCDPATVLHFKYRFHCVKHEHRDGCNGRIPFTCPACIPVEPQSAMPLICPKPNSADCSKLCPYAPCVKQQRDADMAILDGICNRCGWIPIEGMAEYLKIHGNIALPTMPLINTEAICIKCLAGKRGERIDCPRLVYGYCKKHLEAQRDADMAWCEEKLQDLQKRLLEYQDCLSKERQGWAEKQSAYEISLVERQVSLESIAEIIGINTSSEEWWDISVEKQFELIKTKLQAHD